MLVADLVSHAKALSPSERLELIGEVWDSIDASELAVSDDERRLLDARIAEVAAEPGAESAWSEARVRLEKKTP